MTWFRRARERRGTPADSLVVGLGNPGREFAGTRHNLGAEVVEVVAARHNGDLRPDRQSARSAEVRIDGRRVVLAVPVSYMNESGGSVARLVKRHGIDDPRNLVVVHDELDLPVGRLKVKDGGGLAGNKGLRSIRQHLHTTDFVRVRLGIGKPRSADRGAEHVLHKPSKADRAELEIVVQEAADAVEALVTEGVDAAMTRFNAR